jgi:hypothetical protein
VPSPNSAAGEGSQRCFEGTEASAKAWLEVAPFGYMLGRLDTLESHGAAKAIGATT